MSIKNNTTSLQSLLETANSLPDAGGVELPTLTNEGLAEDLLAGKELIDQDGNVVTGTFTIDNELNTQDSLITQIQNAVNELPDAGSGNTKNTVTIHVTPNSNTVYYWDADKNQQSISNSTNPITIEALSGVVSYMQVHGSTQYTGNYVQDNIANERFKLSIFLEDGGTMICARDSGTGN